MQEATTRPRYRGYWLAWFGLLAITFLMVTSDHPTLQIAGILVKAAIIALFFMHLRSERFDLALLIAIGVLGSGLALFVLIAPDGMGSSARGARPGSPHSPSSSPLSPGRRARSS